MLIKIKTIDGQNSFALSVSKNIPVSEVRKKLENLTSVKAENQRLFYRGKQLEDGYTIFDYNVRNSDVLQLMIHNKLKAEETEPCSSSSSSLKISGNMPKEVTIPAVSKYFKVGDYVDVWDATYGGWCIARIVEIYSKALYSDGASCSKKTESEYLHSEQASSNKGTKVASDKQKVGGPIDAHEMPKNSSSSKKNTNSVKQKSAKEEELRASDDLFYKVVINNKRNDIFIEASLQEIRPVARNKIKLSDLKRDDLVLVNFNIDEPKKIGNWYDFRVTEIKMKTGGVDLRGTLILGKDDVSLPNTKIWYLKEIFQIQKSYLLKNRSLADEKIMKTPAHRKSQHITLCTFCSDNPKKKCKECSCCICGGKEDPGKQILCDECDKAYHITCLNPPMDQVPDFDWYCPECKTDVNEIVKAGEKLKESKKKPKMASKNSKRKRDWGSGMACVGRTKECTLVPSNHYGPIPGVEVGQIWLYRLQVSEAGVHRPHVAGIHGREKDGAYSLVFSGGYEGDVDYGNEFWYTGSGGRDLSGNKRTASQSSDQKLTRMNKALALNCAAKLNEKGAVAKKWKEGKPVRVVRNHKLRKKSKYAPVIGNRYDGIYKVVKYLPKKGKSGFIIWRYFLRRDDPNPAPWTPEGKKRIENLGLQIPEPPEGYEFKVPEEKGQNAVKSKKQKRSTQDICGSPEQKKQKVKPHILSSVEMKLMEKDKLNKKRWEECCQKLQEGKQKFLSVVQEAFQCVICLDLVRSPVTTPCKHNICITCLKRAKSADILTCPCCRTPLGADFIADVNKYLNDLLSKIFPGYAHH